MTDLGLYKRTIEKVLVDFFTCKDPEDAACVFSREYLREIL